MKNHNLFNNRDISWLYFNERVLLESQRDYVPLLEKLKFLAIYSSNLDEFFRVRIPLLHGWKKLDKKGKLDSTDQQAELNVYKKAKNIIKKQQELFGHILTQEIIPGLSKHNIILHYDLALPEFALTTLREFFLAEIASYLHVSKLEDHTDFFPLNNELYFFILTSNQERYFCPIPSSSVGRFKTIVHEEKYYIFFIDDIIKHFLAEANLIPNIESFYSFKVTRDAELNLQEEAGTDLTEALIKELSKRDFGIATRLLYQSDLPSEELAILLDCLNLKKSNTMKGGKYHNLKDFFDFPAHNRQLEYSQAVSIEPPFQELLNSNSIFSVLQQQEILLHTPYHSYDTVLRFFNEAAMDESVQSIWVTLYRLAKDSKIGRALLNAAQNGKKVNVFVELKARFDESNNLQWARRLEQAGVNISYSIPKIKVHAKVALVERLENEQIKYYGLLSTGNLNENTAKVYTDHSLLTSDEKPLKELATLFDFLTKHREKIHDKELVFHHLLVAHFNLYDEFMNLIDHEIEQAKAGRIAFIRIKLNNLEEETLIKKLYEASSAGVRIELIVRSICRIIPNQIGLSENITVRRIVGRYLEHSRIFHFHHAGDNLVYIGSSDWMNRNIYHRIEVCFPIKNELYKQQLLKYLDIQLADDTSASSINNLGQNEIPEINNFIDAQEEIPRFLIHCD
ncbi:polyphosphate kinase 1 [Sphingobacterium sp. SGL-16]|uniref:polyphosphate kinase 1 n=1 Tax=Sphingobacterium sp. SGL-16 TaxID=2710883 RepID=UPI0013EDD64A|nr:polyphosphate kinase 1 [Sphingobacterium sp. SGL-16]NGM71900.1 polyphosphate kinase 1 [Sphingobacterium sp. SGL-16]